MSSSSQENAGNTVGTGPSLLCQAISLKDQIIRGKSHVSPTESRREHVSGPGCSARTGTGVYLWDSEIKGEGSFLVVWLITRACHAGVRPGEVCLLQTVLARQRCLWLYGADDKCLFTASSQWCLAACRPLSTPVFFNRQTASQDTCAHLHTAFFN